MRGSPDKFVSRTGIGLLAGLAMLAAACTSLPVTPTPTELAASERAGSREERIFLYQSRVADALLDRYPLIEIFAGADPDLIAAEARMTETCSPLTRAVLARLQGEQLSLGLRLQVFTTLGECERAARTIDHLLIDTRHGLSSGDSI